MKMKPYPKYKPSGVEWLGEVPVGWEVKRLKFLFSWNTKKTESRDNPIALENIESWTGRYVETESEFDGEGVYFQEGDVLFGKLRPYLAKVYMADRSGEAIGDFFVLHPRKEVIGKYASYLIRTRNYIEVIDGSTFGAKMPRASWDFMGSLPFLLPSTSEQQSIVSFLDRETGKIDELISKKEQLIERLKEKRTALISAAVTKGLNPDVRLKPSGVEWLGDVPEHWEVKKVSYTTYVKGRIGWQGLKSDEFIDEGPFLVTGTDFDNGRIFWDRCYHVSPERYAEDPYIHLRNGDLLITKDGTIGKLAIVSDLKGHATLNSGIFLTRPLKNEYFTRFMYWVLSSKAFIDFIETTKTGTTISHLYQNVFVRFVFPCPNIKEQQSIASFLDRETGKIDALMEKVRLAIEKLKEYRTALISAAVTGKIDVRDIA